jgi:hypothetical protein
MKINYKKSLKLATLLITAIIIATVSADVFEQMFMKSTITVEGVEVKYTTGNDTAAAGGTINDPGTEVTFTGMKGKKGSIKTYGQAVNITNLNTTASHDIELKLSSWNGSTLNTLKWINVTVYNDTGTRVGDTIKLIPGGTNVETTGTLTIPAGKTWYVEWSFLWATDAQDSDAVEVTLVLVVK